MEGFLIKLKLFFIFLLIFIIQNSIAALAKSKENHIETSVSKWFGNKAIYLFQKYISPIDGGRCNFYPSCSVYSQECINKWGLFRGIIMSADRLQRCNSCVRAEDYPQQNHSKYWDPPDENNFW